MPESPASRIKLQIDGALATVILDRAEKLHALTPEMMETLAGIAARIDADAGIRCVILTAAGDKAFCVGADINAWAALEPLDMWRSWVRRGHQVFDRWARLRVPVIAAINGHAIAGGMEIVQGTDIRVAVPTAKFGVQEVKWALFPAGGSSVRLPLQLPYAKAMELLLTGDLITADEALALGFLNYVTEDVMGRALEIAHKIAANGPLAVKAIRASVKACLGKPEAEALALETQFSGPVFLTEDAKEGPRAFLQKRAPVYRGQ